MGAFPLAIAGRPIADPGEAPRAKPLALGIDVLDAALPDAGLPRAAVVEVAGSAGLGGITRLALAACHAAQREDASWCAWVDPSATLYAPGVRAAGVDLERLLVVRPEPEEMAKVAVRLVQSGVFSVVVLDRAGVPGAMPGRTRIRWPTAVRRLALAASESDATVLLVSTVEQARAEPLPVALRLELGRPAPERIAIRVTKDRRGRLGTAVLPARVA
jgi:recombination protein RecA